MTIPETPREEPDEMLERYREVAREFRGTNASAAIIGLIEIIIRLYAKIDAQPKAEASDLERARTALHNTMAGSQPAVIKAVAVAQRRQGMGETACWRDSDAIRLRST